MSRPRRQWTLCRRRHKVHRRPNLLAGIPCGTQAEIKDACRAAFDTENLKIPPGPKLAEIIGARTGELATSCQGLYLARSQVRDRRPAWPPACGSPPDNATGPGTPASSSGPSARPAASTIRITPSELGAPVRCELCSASVPFGTYIANSPQRPAAWAMKVMPALDQAHFSETIPVMAALSVFHAACGKGFTGTGMTYLVGAEAVTSAMKCEIDFMILIQDAELPAVIISEAKAGNPAHPAPGALLSSDKLADLEAVQDSFRALGIDCWICFATTRPALEQSEIDLLRRSCERSLTAGGSAKSSTRPDKLPPWRRSSSDRSALARLGRLFRQAPCIQGAPPLLPCCADRAGRQRPPGRSREEMSKSDIRLASGRRAGAAAAAHRGRRWPGGRRPCPSGIGPAGPAGCRSASRAGSAGRARRGGSPDRRPGCVTAGGPGTARRPGWPRPRRPDRRWPARVGAQLQGGEQVPHPAAAVVGGPPPPRPLAGVPGGAAAAGGWWPTGMNRSPNLRRVRQ